MARRIQILKPVYTKLAKDNGLVAVDEHAMINVVFHGSGQRDIFHVTADRNQLFRTVGVIYTLNGLLDD